MQKIIKLDENLINQIAAGEVVERPASVVKELVENSLDAGATLISVEILDGGKQEIKVTDNGEGINKKDFSILLEKHTTSKISNLRDLHNVMTFGFRGEALSSISSVSNFTISSRTAGDNFGYSMNFSSGKMTDIGEVPLELGTQILVQDLFHNTPARLGYLKRAGTEKSHIQQFLQSMALAYPEVSFEFIAENKKVFGYRAGEDLATRIFHIYGKDFSENGLAIDFEFSGLKVEGIISDPKVSFPNRNRQSLFVNNRLIKSGLIFKAISDAYNRFIPHGNYGAFVLNLEIDPTQIDVNVHPRKLEIKFANEQTIFRAFYQAIMSRLEGVSLVDSCSVAPSVSTNFSFQDATTKPEYYTGSGTKFKSYSPYKNTAPNPNQMKVSDAINFSKGILTDTSTLEGGAGEYHQNADLTQTPLGKIIGQVHNSYIVVETPNGMQVLDQHALAERVIYEQLIHKKVQKNVQGLLISESITLLPQEKNILELHAQVFQEMGFDFEILGQDIVMVNGIPDFVKKEKISEIFRGVLGDIGEFNTGKSKTLEEITNKIHAYTACRSAIKFGHTLSLFEMNALLKDSVIGYTATCPHGRPVVFDIGLDELKDRYER